MSYEKNNLKWKNIDDTHMDIQSFYNVYQRQKKKEIESKKNKNYLLHKKYKRLYDDLFYDLKNTWYPYGFFTKADRKSFSKMMLSNIHISKYNTIIPIEENFEDSS